MAEAGAVTVEEVVVAAVPMEAVGLALTWAAGGHTTAGVPAAHTAATREAVLSVAVLAAAPEAVEWPRGRSGGTLELHRVLVAKAGDRSSAIIARREAVLAAAELAQEFPVAALAESAVRGRDLE